MNLGFIMMVVAGLIMMVGLVHAVFDVLAPRIDRVLFGMVTEDQR